MNNHPQNMPRSFPSRRKRQTVSAATIIFAFVLVICLSVTMGYLVTKQIIYPYILKQNLSDGGQSASSGGIIVDENEIPSAKPSADGPVVSPDNSPGENTQVPDNANDPVTATTGNPGGSDNTSPPSSSGYCLQYASLSTQDAADQFVSDLKTKGITSSVKESNGHYKVVSPAYATKDEARSHIPAVSTVVPDVFVTSAF